MPSSFSLRKKGLYVITDGPRSDLIEVVTHALHAGAQLVQYRDKTQDAQRRFAEATALLTLCHQFNTPLIINDDVALAVAIGANGVHLGKTDEHIINARTILGVNAIIGISCYNSLARAQKAEKDGASYVAFGAFFNSSTKPLARHADINLLQRSATLSIPKVAIGGITPDNGAPLIQAGADYLAVVSAVFGTSDVYAAAQRFTQLF